MEASLDQRPRRGIEAEGQEGLAGPSKEFQNPDQQGSREA